MNKSIYKKACNKWKSEEDVKKCLEKGYTIEEISKGYCLREISLVDYIDSALLERLVLRYPLRMMILKEIDYLAENNEEYNKTTLTEKIRKDNIRFDIELLKMIKNIDPTNCYLYMPIKCKENEDLKSILIDNKENIDKFNHIVDIKKIDINKQLIELSKLLAAKKEEVVKSIQDVCDWYQPKLQGSALLEGLINESINLAYGNAVVTLDNNYHLNEIQIKNLKVGENPYNQVYHAVHCIENDVLPHLKNNLQSIGEEIEEEQEEDYEMELEKFF